MAEPNGVGLTDLILMAGGLGTAAFGVVETMKGTWLGTVGLSRLEQTIGAAGMDALRAVWGQEAWRSVLRGAMREGTEALTQKTLDALQIAVALPPANEASTRPADAAVRGEAGSGQPPRDVGRALAAQCGQDPDAVDHARVCLQRAEREDEEGGLDEGEARAVQAAAPVSEAEILEAQAVMGRLELALRARVEAGATSAREMHAASMRFIAGLIAVAGSLAAAAALPDLYGDDRWAVALIAGILAVPIAPVAKDVVRVVDKAGQLLKTWNRVR